MLAADEQVAWLVEFWAPWCTHCKQLHPVFRKAAASRKLDGNARLAAVDGTSARGLIERFGVKSYPTLLIFKGPDCEPYRCVPSHPRLASSSTHAAGTRRTAARLRGRITDPAAYGPTVCSPTQADIGTVHERPARLCEAETEASPVLKFRAAGFTMCNVEGGY